MMDSNVSRNDTDTRVPLRVHHHSAEGTGNRSLSLVSMAQSPSSTLSAHCSLHAAMNILPALNLSSRDGVCEESNIINAAGNSSILPEGITGDRISAAFVSGRSTESTPLDLINLFECPICTDYALPPILQCQKGHIVCAQYNIRNLAMEKLASSLLFPCKYSTSGCPKSFHFTTKLDHEKLCEYRPYLCPCPGTSCKWIGQLPQVLPHLMQQHKSITTLQGADIVFLATDVNMPGTVDWVMMQSCFGHNFLLVLEKQERIPSHMFFALVQLIGAKKQAEQFAYR
ncbi:unnamed protein product [Protopolystoma xenopodis]|uniref:E3 ubiquitin-protein ligase n=1 Tax=Protopolystoma xenopodis TaxID=117903 RepID=A0A3S5A803_9PLAT|nr:unnamed protein product [Protopolystoma xenopodis]